MAKSKLSSIVEQEYLTWKQLLTTCLAVIFIIQTIPFFVTPTPYMEWMLLGFNRRRFHLCRSRCGSCSI